MHGKNFGSEIEVGGGGHAPWPPMATPLHLELIVWKCSVNIKYLVILVRRDVPFLQSLRICHKI